MSPEIRLLDRIPENGVAIGHPLRFVISIDADGRDDAANSNIIHDHEKGTGAGPFWKLTYVSRPVFRNILIKEGVAYLTAVVR